MGDPAMDEWMERMAQRFPGNESGPATQAPPGRPGADAARGELEELKRRVPELEQRYQRHQQEMQSYAQSACIHGSRRFTPTPATREVLEQREHAEDVGRLIGGAPDPGEQATDNLIEGQTRRELEALADQELQAARRWHEELVKTHEHLCRLHQARGEPYTAHAPAFRGP